MNTCLLVRDIPTNIDFWKRKFLEKEGDFINAFDYIAIEVPSL
jgi:hypothetical protein